MMPIARTTGSGNGRAMRLRALSPAAMTRPLRALRLRFPTLEILDDRFPIAALAQQPLHCLAERALAAAAGELPLRDFSHLWRGVFRCGGDSGAQHRREIRKIVAEVEDLVEAELEFVNQPLTRIEFVLRSLMQLLNPELARTTNESGGAAAGQQRNGDANFLRQLGRQTVANIELFDLACFAGVDDFAVRPDAVDVGDDQADVESAGGHARMLTAR